MDAAVVNTIVSGSLALACITAGSILLAIGVDSGGHVLLGAGVGIVGKYAADRRA